MVTAEEQAELQKGANRAAIAGERLREIEGAQRHAAPQKTKPLRPQRHGMANVLETPTSGQMA